MFHSMILIFLSISALAHGGTLQAADTQNFSDRESLTTLLQQFEVSPFVETTSTPSFLLNLPEGQLQWEKGKAQKRSFIFQGDTLHHLLLSGKGNLLLQPKDSLNAAALEGFLGKAPLEKKTKTLHLFFDRLPADMQEWPFKPVKAGKISTLLRAARLKKTLKDVVPLRPGHPILRWRTWQLQIGNPPFLLLHTEPSGLRLQTLSDDAQSISRVLFDGSSVVAPLQTTHTQTGRTSTKTQISGLLAHASLPASLTEPAIRSIHHAFKRLPTGAVDFQSTFKLKGNAPFLFLLLDPAVELAALLPTFQRQKHSPWIFIERPKNLTRFQLRGHVPSHAIEFGRAWLAMPSTPHPQIPTSFSMEPSHAASLYLPPGSFFREPTRAGKASLKSKSPASESPTSSDSLRVFSMSPTELPWLDIRHRHDLLPHLTLLRNSNRSIQTESSKERRNTAEFKYDEELLETDRNFRPPNPMDVYEAGIEPDLLTPPKEATRAALKLVNEDLEIELKHTYLALEKILGPPPGTLLLIEGNPPTSRRAQQQGLANTPFSTSFPALLSTTMLQQSSPWARLYRSEALARQWSPLNARARIHAPRWFLWGIARTAALIALETQGIETATLRDEALRKETRNFTPKPSSTHALLGERAGGQWMSDPLQSQLAWRFCFLLENLRWRLHAADVQPMAFLHCLRLEDFNPDLEDRGLELWFEHQLKPLLAKLNPGDADEELLNFIRLLGLTKPPEILVSLVELETSTGIPMVRIQREGIADGLRLSLPILIETESGREWKLLESRNSEEFFPLGEKEILAWQVAPQGNPWLRITQQ